MNEQESYLLLTVHATPSGADSRWKMFDYIKDARTALEQMKLESEQIERISFPVHIGPILVQHVILKVVEVVP